MVGQVAVAAGLVGAAAWAVRGRSSSILAPSVYRGSSTRPAIALTFDDGPSESTPALQLLLAEYNARATFFQCGIHVRRLPQVTHDLAQGGHEIANHTDSHPQLWLRSPQFIYDELARAQESIAHACGVQSKLFRAPYGVRWLGLRAAQQRLNLLGVMWTALGLDWKLSPEAVAHRLLSRASNGAIFCLHDGRATQTNPNISTTFEAVRLILPELAARGFEFLTVSDLLRVK